MRLDRSEPGSWPGTQQASLHRELAEEYQELPWQSITSALNQATRAAAALTNDTTLARTAESPLVARLARDRLEALRGRYLAATRRIDRFPARLESI